MSTEPIFEKDGTNGLAGKGVTPVVCHFSLTAQSQSVRLQALDEGRSHGETQGATWCHSEGRQARS
jgi:hypothetical protein